MQHYPSMDEVFLKVVSEHIAGDPMNEKIRWVKLSRFEITEKMKLSGINVSRRIIKNLLKKHHFVKRKMQRRRSTGKSVHREAQFHNILVEKTKFMESGNPIISIDTKKKEQIGGSLHRAGSVYCTQAIEAADHDWAHLAEAKIVPHGIYDIKRNKAHINIGTGSETAEFVCDSIKEWWDKVGKEDYPNADEVLIFCDSGGANSYRHHIFKAELQKLSNEVNLKLCMAHYPPYTSKWNPIEHRVFPHVTRAMEGIPLNTIDEAKTRIESTKTKTGLTVSANVIRKIYEKGKRGTKELIETLKIKFGESVPHLNYTISPAGAN